MKDQNEIKSKTITILKVVMWFIVTMFIWDGGSTLVSAPDTLAVICGFALFIAWVWITVKSWFFTNIHTPKIFKKNH